MAILLLQESFNTHDRIDKINYYSKQLYISNKITDDISIITSNSQMYILHADKQYLEAFRLYSAKVIEEELELYNNLTNANKENIQDIIELTKTYISFVENEVVPIIQSNNSAKTDIRYIQLRHNEFSQELTQRAAKINSTNVAELNTFFQETVTNMRGKISLLVIILVLSLVLLLGGMYTNVKSLLQQYYYLRNLSEQVEHAVLIVDQKGYFKNINKSTREVLGIDPDKLIDINISEIPYQFPRLQSIIQPLYQVILQKKELVNQIIPYSYHDRKINLKIDYTPVLSPGNKLKGIIINADVVKEHKDKYILLDTLEVERKRISIEIHDWIARYLSTIIHSIDYLLRLKSIPEDELKDNLKTIRNHCQSAAIEMRGIMNNVHPYLIDKVGLVSALESYINIYEKLNNIKVYIFYQERSLNLSSKKGIIIYRIIQEALSNIAKHSRATEVDIHFTVEDDLLRIEIEDNGGEVTDFIAGKGMWGMKERAKLIGGDIKFENIATGFCVSLSVPLDMEGHIDEKKD